MRLRAVHDATIRRERQRAVGAQLRNLSGVEHQQLPQVAEQLLFLIRLS